MKWLIMYKYSLSFVWALNLALSIERLGIATMIPKKLQLLIELTKKESQKTTKIGFHIKTTTDDSSQQLIANPSSFDLRF